MAWLRWVTAIAASAVLGLAGCGSSNPNFQCANDGQCNAMSGGKCILATSYCAYPATDCASGYKYSMNAGTLSGQCIQPAGNDMRVADMGVRSENVAADTMRSADTLATPDTVPPVDMMPSPESFACGAGTRMCNGTGPCISDSDPLWSMDDHECGSTGGGCLSNSTCLNGSCTGLTITGVLNSSFTNFKPTGPVLITASGNLYWNGSQGFSGACNPAGGGCAGGGAFSCAFGGNITYLATNGGTTMYYVYPKGTGTSGNPEIWEIVNNGSAHMVTSDTSGINGLVIDPSNDLFWTDDAGNLIELVGGAGSPQALIAAGTGTPPFAVRLKVVGTTVYYAAQGSGATTGEIRAVPIGGGGAYTQLGTNQAMPEDVVVVGNNIYWTNTGDGTVWTNSITATGPSTAKMIASGQSMPGSITADASALFWANGGTEVVKLPLCGGAPITIASARNGVGDVVVLNGNVYWTETGANNLFSAPE
jgi:hypothetical protein